MLKNDKWQCTKSTQIKCNIYLRNAKAGMACCCSCVIKCGVWFKCHNILDILMPQNSAYTNAFCCVHKQRRCTVQTCIWGQTLLSAAPWRRGTRHSGCGALILMHRLGLVLFWRWAAIKASLFLCFRSEMWGKGLTCWWWNQVCHIWTL